MKTIYFILVVLISSCIKVNAQGWCDRINSDFSVYRGDMLLTPDNRMLWFYTEAFTTTKLIKTDEFGNQIFNKSFELNNARASKIINYENNYILLYNDLFALINNNGDSIYTKHINILDYQKCMDIMVTTDNNFIIIGYGYVTQYKSFVLKTDINGNIIWYKFFNSINQANSIIQTPDSNYLVCGYTSNFGNGSSDIVLFKINENGDSLWSKTYGGALEENGYSLKKYSDDKILILGFTKSYGAGNKDIYLLQTNYNGDSIWSKTIGTSENDEICTNMIINNKKEIIIGGYNGLPHYLWDSIVYNANIIKLDSLGNTIWNKELNNYPLDWDYEFRNHSLKFDNSGNIYAFCSDSVTAFLYKFDSLGNFNENLFHGNVYFDLNQNCIKDSTDTPFVNGIIKIDNDYSVTDENGNYSVLIDSGSYNITFINNLPYNNYYTVVCPSPNYIYNVNISAQNTIVNNIDFGLMKTDCPLLTVDMVTSTFRRCQTHSLLYIVSYRNNSNVTVDSVYINVKFDPFIIIDSLPSSLQYQINANNDYTFFIDSVSANVLYNLKIYYKVLCSAQLGQTLCNEARIYPKYLCENEDPQWDKSSISITSSCVGDSLVCFTIYNTGSSVNGNMQGTSTYRLFEDNALAQTGTFQLAGGDSLVLCYTANGKTLRLEADQRPGHPGNSHPNASIELCGNSANPSLGFITQFPEDDQDAFVEIDCQEVVGSYDPNEKLVKPKGITSEKFIPNGTQLEYQINFQNTGTDTAFLVVIRDTLSQYLNVETIEFGVTSHTATYKLYGTGIIEWTFNNIMLPDSNVNEAESHGFVKYKIRLKQALDNGTLIENRAGIIFDYNAPIITNFALNKVYDTTLVVTIPIKEQINYKGFSVFPNPAISQVNISTNNEIIESIELYNEIGVKVDEIVVKNNTSSLIYINKQKMSGLYFIKVKTKENIYTGKIVFK